MESTRAIPRSPAPQSRRILAIDYGRRRIGLAISDELRLTASPLAIIERKNRREDMRRLREIVRKNGVGLILVGSPVHLGGHAGEMAEEAARFAERIRKELGLPVELRDERLTSWEAEEIAKEVLDRKDAKKNIDSMAAAILLREHLDESRNGKPAAAKGQ
ncbi:MAG: Holliday junction resolvase RuvX [Candidatus Acidiferrales bacterium]